MRPIIPLNVHNVMDYVVGTALVLSPFVFGFSDVPMARSLFLVLGLGLIGYSLVTRYRYSIAKIIPLGVHMFMDFAAGVIVMAAPWLMGYRGQLTGGQTAVHIIFGLGAIGLVAFTKPRTERGKLMMPTTRTDATITGSTRVETENRRRAA